MLGWSTDMDCIEALKTRRSVRAYTGEPVSREVIEDIIDCGRLAATAINLQPWEFVAVAEREMLRAIARYPKRTHEETDQRSAKCAG